MTLEITLLSVGKIKLPDQSLKAHPARQIQQIVASIEAFGFNDPVAVDEHHAVIEGTGRILAARELGLKTVPVIVLKHLNQAQKQAYRIAHNKICLNSDFNLEALRQEFDALSQLDESLLSLTGFETVEIEDLMTVPALPELGIELTESMNDAASVICPHCGETVYV